MTFTNASGFNSITFDMFVAAGTGSYGIGRLANTPVPEPATITLLGIGLAGLAGAEVRRRRKKKAVDNN